MSHFVVLVFTKENGKSVEELLAPYNENKECDPYVKYTKEQAIDAIRKEIEDFKNGPYASFLADSEAYAQSCYSEEHLDFIQNEFPKWLHWTDEECYEYMKSRFCESMVAPNGDLLSTYNPNAKLNYWCVGSRWDICVTKLNGKQTNQDYVKDINWENSIIPLAFVTPNGEWHELGEMGIGEMAPYEKVYQDWEAEFKNYVADLDEDTIVTVVDCNIELPAE